MAVKPPAISDRPQSSLPWHPAAALVFVVILYFAAPIISGLTVSIYPELRGWSEAHLEDWITNSVFAQFFYVLLAEALTISSLLVFLRHYKRRLSDIGLKRPRFKDFGIGLLAYPVYFIMFAVAVVVVSRFVPGVDVDQQQQIGFDSVHGAVALTLTFISLVILPPLAEEIAVRGFLFTSLRSRLSFIPALLITSLAFAIAHLPEGGAAGPLYIAAIDTFLLSVVLCFVREKTGSLWAGITIHAIKNGVAFLSLFILASR